MIENFRSAVSDNVRQCGYFVQIFEDSWGPKNLARKMFHLACDSRSDDTLPMKEVAVFLKDAPRETDPEILAFRKEIVDLSDVNVYYFKTSEEMRAQLRQVAEGWLGRILADPAAGASSAAASSV